MPDQFDLIAAQGGVDGNLHGFWLKVALTMDIRSHISDNKRNQAALSVLTVSCVHSAPIPSDSAQPQKYTTWIQGCSFKYSFALINSPYLAAKMKFDLIFKTLLMNSASEKVKCNLTTVRNIYSSKLNTLTVTILVIYEHTSNSQRNMKISIFETLSSFDSYAQDIRIVECCVAI